MRLLSGSGLAGLRGIHPRREDGVIRPLLGVTRAQLESFLSERGVTPRLDRSNEDPRFLRNRVRRIVRELEATEQLAKVAAQARAQWPVFEAAIEDAERMHVTSDARETRFHSWPNDEWLRAALLQRHIHRLDPEARDFDAVRIARSLDEIKRVTVTRKLELLRKGGALILRMRMDPCEPYEYEAHGEEWTIGIESIEKVLRLERFDEASTRASQKIQLANGSTGNWRVRNRRPGDRFQPLGMPNAKKLKDFLIDRKIPAETRDRIPLLLWNDEIVWVAGIEVAERFKVTASEGVIYEVWMEDPR
jgi:tRNA(Ile)-lysidine synthase